MVVENGDRVRVTNLEKKTDNLAGEVATLGGKVATLGGEFHTHIKQVAAHRREAISENVKRDELANQHFGEIMTGPASRPRCAAPVPGRSHARQPC